MAAGALPHVGSGAPFPCPIDASHDGRRPERSGFAPAAAWPSRKFAGCLCWTNAYRQAFDALSVSKVLWRSQRSDSLTSDEVGAASRQRRLNLCQRPEGSPPSSCGLPTLWQLHIAFDQHEAKRLSSLVEKGDTSFGSGAPPTSALLVPSWRCDVALPTRRSVGRAPCARALGELSHRPHLHHRSGPFPREPHHRC